MSVKVVYENWREDVYTEDYPSEPDAIVAAEKILSKMGLNKPSTLN